MTRIAVFDCDGTLVDGQAEVCQSMAEAFAGEGLPLPDMNLVRRIVGLSLPAAIRRLAPELDDDINARIVAGYKQAFFARRQEGRIHEPLYDGMADLLHALKGDGWMLAVATGKSDRGLSACLTAHGLIDLFTSLQTADRHPSKPHPAMLEAAIFECGGESSGAVMIGDTSFDMEMARAAGVRAVGVDWGYHAAAELLEYGAVSVAKDITQLRDMIDAATR